MGDSAQGLQHDQARLGVLPVGAATEDVPRQLKVVSRRIVAAQAELEAVLARGRAVTGARVATADVESGDDLAAEAVRLRLVQSPHHDRPPPPLPARRL